MTGLGRLQPVDLRAAWSDEAGDFTPWLAQEDNLDRLGEALGLELERDREEMPVGDFRADIVCRALDLDAIVLIENQLQRTDHRHLGQLLTNAAGLSAAQVVWIAAEFREERRAALDRLNEMTPENVGFHGVEVALWRIGDSLPAPRFNVVSRPNAWTRSIARAARGGASDGLQTKRLACCTAFAQRPSVRDLGLRRPNETPCLVASLGRSGFRIAAAISSQKQRVRVEFMLLDDLSKAGFDALLADREAIEAAYGSPLGWVRLDGLPRSRVHDDLAPADREDPDDQERQHAWLEDRLRRMRRDFGPRLPGLPKDGDLSGDLS